MERAKGIEPSSSAWKADALPLSYARNGNVRSLSNGRMTVNSHFGQKNAYEVSWCDSQPHLGTVADAHGKIW